MLPVRWPRDSVTHVISAVLKLLEFQLLAKSVNIMSLELFWKVILQSVSSWAMKWNKLQVNHIHSYHKKIILTTFFSLNISSDITNHFRINYN